MAGRRGRHRREPCDERGAQGDADGVARLTAQYRGPQTRGGGTGRGRAGCLRRGGRPRAEGRRCGVIHHLVAERGERASRTQIALSRLACRRSRTCGVGGRLRVVRDRYGRGHARRRAADRAARAGRRAKQLRTEHGQYVITHALGRLALEEPRGQCRSHVLLGSIEEDTERLLAEWRRRRGRGRWLRRVKRSRRE